MENFVGGFLAGAFFAAVIFVFTTTPNLVWKGQAIERGYGLYCPDTGDFAWVNECKGK